MNEIYTIGESLTLMLKNFILSKVTEPDSLKAFEKVVTPEMVEILKNDTVCENYGNVNKRKQRKNLYF